MKASLPMAIKLPVSTMWIEGEIPGAASDVSATPSGAAHDAQSLAVVCPVAMIFVASKAGIRHAPG